MEKYIALVEEDGGNYGVVFPDLPGIVSAGSSFDDAVKNAHEIVAYYAQTVSTSELPRPRTLEEIEQTWEDWQEWKENYHFVVTYISVIPVTTKTRRINIVMDEGLLARLDRVTKNRSEFINKVVEHALI
ncbi:HicB family protein [Spirochaetia bacterium]|nr:HicB family protein [Spirochaetia bacterium]